MEIIPPPTEIRSPASPAGPGRGRRGVWRVAGVLATGLAAGFLGLAWLRGGNPSGWAAEAGAGNRGGTERAGPGFGDFVGSAACASCHPREHALWTNSTHGRAGGRPGETPIVARFDGRPLRFRDATVTPTTNRAGDYLFRIERPGEPGLEVKVDAVIGGGHLHGGGTQSFFTRHPDGTYRFLPFDFIRRENLWFVQKRADLAWHPVSEALSLQEDLANWPPRRVLGTTSEFSNCQNCHGSQITLQYDAQAAAYQTRFETLRINCESCHGPGRRHLEIVGRPGWETRADLGLTALATLNQQESMEVCHRCHATKDALRDDPYLPGARFEDYFSLKLGLLLESPYHADGRIRSFGYQANHEFSDCYLNGSMTCVDCHDPHAQGYRDAFGRALPGRFDNGQCTGCHASKGLAPEAHSHHQAGSAGNQCVACHMPYLQHQGIGRHLVFTRSDHTIPIPRPAFDQGLGIENACQKCHADHDLAWQQGHVDRWYGRVKPHPPLVAALARARAGQAMPRTPGEAAVAWLDPDARHPMAQAAGLAEFLERFLVPAMPERDPEVLRRLQRLADSPDPDLQALALAGLHIGYGDDPGLRPWVEGRLQGLPEEGAIRRRWALTADKLGGGWAGKGNLPRAVACFEKGLAVQPRNEVLLSHLAQAEAQLGRLEAAVQTLQRAVAMRPAKAALQFQLALMLARAGRMPEAGAAAEQGVRLAPHDANGRALLEELRAAGR